MKKTFWAAMVAGVAITAAARTMTVTENKVDGVTTSFDLTFSAESAETTNSVWLVCGMSDGGTASLEDWSSSRFLTQVPGDVTSVANVSLPDGWGSTVTHLRFILTTGGTGVPNADILEYIESSGSQYVMTSFTANGKSAVEADFQFTTTSGNQCIFCSRGGNLSANTFTLFWLGSNWRWDYNNAQKAPSTAVSPGTTRHSLRADSGGLTVDGTLLAGTEHPASTFTAAGTMSIFASHTGGSGWGNYGKWKLYSFKAWADASDDSTLKLDLVPCRKQDGTVCLYNTVGGKFLTNGGSGTFTAGPVAATASATEVVAASGLVTVPLQGWHTSGGAIYTYVNPIYVVDVAANGSNSIDEVTFHKLAAAGASVTTDVSYAEFVGESRTGTIIKRGGGTLTFNRDISKFTGPVHIEEGVGIGTCSNCFGFVNASADSANQRTYVHSGATLVMDAIGDKPAYAERNAAYYEGEGYPGMGGALVWRNGNKASGGSRWPVGVASRAMGTAKIYIDVLSDASVTITYGESKQPGSDFSIDNQDVLMYGRTVGSRLSILANSIYGFKNLVVSNMTLWVWGNSGRILPKNGNSSTLRFTGGARWRWGTDDNLSGTQNGQTATLYIDDLEYILFERGSRDDSNYGVNPWGVTDGTTNNWWRGPVILNDDIRMYNGNSPRNAGTRRRYGFTFSAKVSGPKGFRSWANANGVSWGDGTRLNLIYPTNTFEGGIVMDGGSIGVWAEKAVPSQEGAGLVSITNGYVYFGRQGRAPSTKKWPVFTMPVTEFVGSGAVTNGTGRWQGLVKKGAGTLDYNSQLDGDFLDLQEGVVAFNTQYRAEYAGDNAAYVPAGYEAALPQFTTLKGTTGRLDLSGAGGAYTVTNMFGTPSVTNGDLTVTGTWTLDATTLGANTAKFSGTLAFGEGASIAVSGDLGAVANPHGAGYLVAKAANVTGLPRFHAGKWLLLESGGEVRLFDGSGTMLIFR